MKIVIVGGGLLGLSMAYYFSCNGYTDTIVIEKNKNLGGACSWIEVDKTIVDRFYHVILAQDGVVLNLMEEIGIKDRYGFANARMGIFNGAKTYSVTTPGDILKYPDLSFIDKTRLAFTLIYSRFIKDWESLEQRSAEEWLISVGGKNNYENLWKPIMRAKFGENISRLTAMDMWSRITRLSSSRKTDLSQTMGYISGTPKTLIDRLESVLLERGVKIIKGNGANQIIAEHEKILKIKLNSGEEIDGDQFFFTTPIPAFENIVPERFSDYKNHLKQIEYMGNASLVLKLASPLNEYYMLNIKDMNAPFTGVIGLSSIYPKTDFDGCSIFYISKYLKASDAFFKLDKESMLSMYMPYLKKINPDFNESWIMGYEVSKSRYAEPFHHIGYSKSIPSISTIFTNGLLATSAHVYPEITVLNTAIRFSRKIVDKFLERRLN